MAPAPAHYPQRAPIDAYGNGGFRFAGMSHRGSVMILPSGIYAWDVKTIDDVTAETCAAFLREIKPPGFVLLGAGPSHALAPEPGLMTLAQSALASAKCEPQQQP